MNAFFYTGASGLGAFQEHLNIIGNNLATSNTAGYKPTETRFENLLYREMYVNTETDPTEGVGVKAVDAGLNMTDGSLRQTNLPLDFALLGHGCFFAVERAEGDVYYTRDGQFQMVSVDDEYYLGTADGSFVLDQDGNRIVFELDDNDLPITDGIQEQIGVYQFANPEALLPLASNLFAQTNQSGAPVSLVEEDGGYRLLTGSIELSGVSVADEMTNMIIAQRGFQFSSRVVQVAQEVEDIVNNLRQ